MFKMPLCPPSSVIHGGPPATAKDAGINGNKDRLTASFVDNITLCVNILVHHIKVLKSESGFLADNDRASRDKSR
jgi:hypothetical protein